MCLQTLTNWLYAQIFSTWAKGVILAMQFISVNKKIVIKCYAYCTCTNAPSLYFRTIEQTQLNCTFCRWDSRVKCSKSWVLWMIQLFLTSFSICRFTGDQYITIVIFSYALYVIHCVTDFWVQSHHDHVSTKVTDLIEVQLHVMNY